MNYEKIHDEAIVVDSHCDTPSMLLENLDLGKRLDRGHLDFVRMKEGGLDVAFFAAYTSNNISPDASTRRAMELISRTYDAIEQNKDKVALALTVEEIRENKKKGLMSICLGMENGSPIQKDLSMLRMFYRFGVRYMTLTHGGNNDICDSCTPKVKRWNGVSPFGIEVIAEMNRLGMVIDVSHISDEAFYDVLKYSKKPIVATHSCCRTLSDHPRNMTDQMIKDLAAAGGVLQINYYPVFLDANVKTDAFNQICDEFDEAQSAFRNEFLYSETKEKADEYLQAYVDVEKRLKAFPKPSYKLIVDHIDYAVSLVGTKHVGLGSDFDGIEFPPQGLEDVSKLGVITKELCERGYSEEDIKLILGENFLRVMKECEAGL